MRESGGDRSAVTGGTRVLSDRIVVKITSKPGETFVDRMIALVEGASRQRTPNEIALNILLASLSIVFVVVVLVLNPIASYAASPVSIPVLVALLVCLIPTTIGALLSAIGIAGMDRLVQRNVLAMSGRAVEAAGDVTTLLLDKTGTITYGNRRASAFVAMKGVGGPELAEYASLSSQADPTPEGVSVVELAAAQGIVAEMPRGPSRFRSRRRRACRGSTSSTARRCERAPRRPWWPGSRHPVPPSPRRCARSCRARRMPSRSRAARPGRRDLDSGGTPGFDGSATSPAPRSLSLSKGPAPRSSRWRRRRRVLGVIHLKDVVKDGLRERFGELRPWASAP